MPVKAAMTMAATGHGDWMRWTCSLRWYSIGDVLILSPLALVSCSPE